jgi:DNA polymerase-3 subunit delta
MMDAGERHPLVVMATLHRHYASMLKLDGSGVVSEQDAAALLGMAPFPAKKAMSQARRLGWAGIARAMTLLADADLALRGAAGWSDELVMEVLVARLTRLGPRTGAGARR